MKDVDQPSTTGGQGHGRPLSFSIISLISGEVQL